MNVKLLQPPKNLTWDAPQAVIAKWDKGIHAAAKEEDNSISIYDYIGSDMFGEGVTVRRIAAALRTIGEKNDVTVNINSPGGNVFEGLAIYNTLREHKGHVTVKVVGLAASAASIIAMAGDDIQVAKAGFVMIHNAWGVVVGNKHDLTEAAKVMGVFDSALAEIYADATGAEKKKIEKMMDAETWLTGQEAVDQGFAHSLLPSDSVEKDEVKAQTALNKIDNALAKSGLSRNDRRALIKEITSTPCAADDITPCADEQWSNAFAGLLETINTTHKELSHV